MFGKAVLDETGQLYVCEVLQLCLVAILASATGRNKNHAPHPAVEGPLQVLCEVHGVDRGGGGSTNLVAIIK
jgi:hypothetical protein